MRNRFDEQLDHLNDEMVEMGNLCEQVISGAINITIADHDDNKVQKVLDIDAEIDRKERETYNKENHFQRRKNHAHSGYQTAGP